jgi:hypothetical protein
MKVQFVYCTSAEYRPFFLLLPNNWQTSQIEIHGQQSRESFLIHSRVTMCRCNFVLQCSPLNWIADNRISRLL